MTDFEALYANYSRDIYRFALYLCGNSAEAEDIASETFARAWNASGEVRAATAKASTSLADTPTNSASCSANSTCMRSSS